MKSPNFVVLLMISSNDLYLSSSILKEVIANSSGFL